MTETLTRRFGHFTLSSSRPTVYCLIKHDDPAMQSLIESGFKSRLPKSYKIIRSMAEYRGGPLLQVGSKDSLDFETAFHQPSMLISSYVTRDALTRKHLLAQVYAKRIAKHPDSLLKTNVKAIENLDLSSSTSLFDLLDDTLLGETLQSNEEKTPADRVWWMLRPDMEGGSQDLSLFSTVDELQATFDSWDDDTEKDHAEGEQLDHANPDHSRSSVHSPVDTDADADAFPSESGGWSSFMHITVTTEEKVEEDKPQRHVIAQRYVSRPLTFDSRKFQVSAYVLAVGALKVFVYRPMLALFANSPFTAPWETSSGNDLQSHSTFEGKVRLFWDLPDQPRGWKESVFNQICGITGEVFAAAGTREMKAHFQPLPQAFELFAANFAVDCTGKAMLADIRASPGFHHQTECGAKLGKMVEGLYEEVAEYAVKPFFEGESAKAPKASGRLVKVVDIDSKLV
ncbi:Tubulin-tyrosine ligase [Macrophomina phaseolina MS6]|uniref:Tubulin-tyrosine ligase n=1 Tax=Macrophomina phaseolina (strain MS6) TaxID=1126212 RepID=K2QNB3_MACPH|nr:Tubulin-tyrosine ligase [Macrophomina phaseolina MS6]